MKRRGRANQDFGALARLWAEVYTKYLLEYPRGGAELTPRGVPASRAPAERAAVAFSAATGLKVLGVGGSRAVFALDDKRVLKMPFHDGALCNVIEHEVWRASTRKKRRWLAPVLDIGLDGAWLVMARARPLSRRLERAVLAGKFDVVSEALGVFDLDFGSNWGLIRHRMVVIDYCYLSADAASSFTRRTSRALPRTLWNWSYSST